MGDGAGAIIQGVFYLGVGFPGVIAQEQLS